MRSIHPASDLELLSRLAWLPIALRFLTYPSGLHNFNLAVRELHDVTVRSRDLAITSINRPFLRSFSGRLSSASVHGLGLGAIVASGGLGATRGD
jgi:hypothetical protein